MFANLVAITLKRQRTRIISAMTISRQTHEQVLGVLASLLDAIRGQDRDTLEALIAPEFSGFFHDRPGRVTGPEEFSASPPAPFVLDGVEVHAEGTIAWVTARMVPDDAPSVPGRFTALLRGTGHTWLVAQVHGSLPA